MESLASGMHMEMLQPTAKFLAVENTILGSDYAEVDLDRNIPVAVLSPLSHWQNDTIGVKGIWAEAVPICFQLFVTFSSQRNLQQPENASEDMDKYLTLCLTTALKNSGCRVNLKQS